MDKKTVLLLSDYVDLPTGVGRMAKSIVKELAKQYNVILLSGNTHITQTVQLDLSSQYDGNVYAYIVKDYSDMNLLRYICNVHNVELMILFNDIYNFYNIFNIEHELRTSGIKILYYHVWDNYPIPHYNKKYYDSCDAIAAISSLTYEVCNELNTDKKYLLSYVPHGLSQDTFYNVKYFNKKVTLNNQLYDEVEVIRSFKQQQFEDSFLIFWNNKNMSRKNLATLLVAFESLYAEHKDMKLLLKTDMRNANGINIEEFLHPYKCKNNVLLIDKVLEDVTLNWYYNISDVVINTSLREGFGLSTLESLYTGTPIIATSTGGLNDQLNAVQHIDGISTRLDVDHSILRGSQMQPYIYEDSVSAERVRLALKEAYKNRIDVDNVIYEEIIHTLHEKKFTETDMNHGISTLIEMCLEKEQKANFEIVEC